jgi:MFS family permease
MYTLFLFPLSRLCCFLPFPSAYVTLETPMATLLKTLRPSRLIPGVTIAWGATVLGSGFLRTYGQLLATRLILGACEAALSPCMFLWLTVWYKRNEIATRQCYLFISAAISGVVGGLIAAGLLKMDGLHGLRGWQVS